MVIAVTMNLPIASRVRLPILPQGIDVAAIVLN